MSPLIFNDDAFELYVITMCLMNVFLASFAIDFVVFTLSNLM